MADAALVEAFLDALAPEARPRFAEQVALPARLAALVDAAHAAWPSVPLPAERFATWIGGRVPEGAAELAVLGDLHAGDLWLACACAAGVPAALAALEGVLAPAAAALARLRLPPAEIDDLLQDLRVALLVRDTSGRARLEEYGGRGPLRAWLRAAALHRGLNLLQRQKRQLPLEDEFVELAIDEHSPEREALRRHRGALKAAVRAAAARLMPRQRNLLRLYFLDGMTFRDLGAFYKVHFVTVQRWLEQARADLALLARQELAARLGGSGDVDSLLRVLQSELELSIAGWLAAC